MQRGQSGQGRELREPRLGRELSRMEETKEGDPAVLAQVDDVPDIERGVLQPQPANRHRPVTRELDASLGELPE